jgi:hypothetical protein
MPSAKYPGIVASIRIISTYYSVHNENGFRKVLMDHIAALGENIRIRAKGLLVQSPQQGGP